MSFTPNQIVGIIPGQASQEKYMGLEAYDTLDIAKHIYKVGKKITGVDLLEYSTETETEDMTGPLVQPALGAAHLSAIELARSRGLIEDGMMGQSVSEIIALTGEGAFSIEDMFKILMARGNAMKMANENNPSIMSAVIGPVREQVDVYVAATQKRLRKLGLPGVYGAMYNSYRQHVVSANPDAMEVFREVVAHIQSLSGAAQKFLGVEFHRTDIKDVKDDGGSHSPYLSEGVQEVFDVIDSVPKTRPRKPVIANNGQLLVNPDGFAGYLAGQLENPAEWYSSIWVAIDMGIRQFVEIEGGKKRILMRNLRHDFPDHNMLREVFGRVIQIESIPEEHRPKKTGQAA